MWWKTMNPEKAYEYVTGNPPCFYTKQGIRSYNEFVKLLEVMSPEQLKKLYAAKDAINIIMDDLETSYFKYKTRDVTPEVMVSHLEQINDKLEIDTPSYWQKAMLKQAKEFLQDFSKSEARFWLHRLEDFNFGDFEFQGPISFKFIRRWIANDSK